MSYKSHHVIWKNQTEQGQEFFLIKCLVVWNFNCNFHYFAFCLCLLAKLSILVSSWCFFIAIEDIEFCWYRKLRMVSEAPGPLTDDINVVTEKPIVRSVVQDIYFWLSKEQWKVLDKENLKTNKSSFHTKKEKKRKEKEANVTNEPNADKWSYLYKNLKIKNWISDLPCWVYDIATVQFI